MALLPEDSALQHERVAQRAPRPLPLFLDLVRQTAASDPELAREALVGLRAYETAPRVPLATPRPEIARVRGACLRDHGGEGRPAVLIPSLINPPRILDLDEQVSLTAAIAGMKRRALLLDWGAAADRALLTVAGHIEELLLPLLHQIEGPPALVGYCLGSTMAIAAANLSECERVATLAAPWNFSNYPEQSRAALQQMWRHSEPAAQVLGALPMEVLQAAFWSLDPVRTVRKFTEFGRLDPKSDEARRFVTLEDWANQGEPLPYPAAKELIEELFGADRSGSGQWCVGGTAVTDAIRAPTLHLLAAHDRIAPAITAPGGAQTAIPAGHVGMIVGSARMALHEALRRFLESE
ncbi:alpha/beta hydrolase [Sphingomonas sp. URHD0057]|uniref:alpha/beta hydrolase n=1 Tax=Sphingomonas sp. URHD0057 TaxID=1380389 RepID=UPI001E5100F5|nr:alpha/beta hydrolase [Sphingomonas sp. URHD0057]